MESRSVVVSPVTTLIGIVYVFFKQVVLAWVPVPDAVVVSRPVVCSSGLPGTRGTRFWWRLVLGCGSPHCLAVSYPMSS